MNLKKGGLYRIIEEGHPQYGRIGRLILTVKKTGNALLKSDELTKQELDKIRKYDPTYNGEKLTVSIVCKTKYLEEVDG